MFFRQKIWSVEVTVVPKLADAAADSLGETALAVTIFVARGNKVRIEALYAEKPDTAGLTAMLAVAAALHKTAPLKFSVREIPQLDWLEKVAQDFPPLSIARWVIHGAGHRGKVSNRRHALQIDAATAFGTGEHPTTRGCLLMLDWILKRKVSARCMLDMGCGSGILAMAFAKARRGRVVAADNDAEAAFVARYNVQANGLRDYVKTGMSHGYRSQLVRRSAPYALIMSNILARPLSQMAKDLKRHLRPGGIAILSGILAPQANMVLAAHRLQGLYLVKHMRIGDWSVLALKRRGRA